MSISLKLLGLTGGVVVGVTTMALVAQAEQPAVQPLSIAYPYDGYETTASRIFFIGTAPPEGEVTVNGQPIDRSTAGHFAPSFPLQLGENVFTFRHQDQELVLNVTRISTDPPAPVGVSFGEGSLTPARDIARLPGELICFSAFAPVNAEVSVLLNQQTNQQTIPLLPQGNAVNLPPNSAVLIQQNQPQPPQPIAAPDSDSNTATTYEGCTTASQPGNLGFPEFRLSLNGETIQQPGTGQIQILAAATPQVVEVTAASGTARTGPSTDHSRLTPLPQGTRASVTGQDGEWLRLDYGGWIRASETQTLSTQIPPQTIIRSIRANQTPGWTEIAFPLQVAVPVSVQQGDRTFTLTLYNTTAQTDTIHLDDDPLIERLDWQQTTSGQVQYTFNLKSAQQWGYKLRYEGTTLILSLRHPPQISRQDLAGVSILLDPGHGGPEDMGGIGSTGYTEKDVTIILAKLLRDRLIERGATVYLTREGDIDLYPQDRVALIDQLEPTIALSIHYNALPDEGDLENTAGVGTFWYNTQAHSLAVFLHNYLVEMLDRPSYGIFWNNLALTRPTVAPSVLLELGFMGNPQEFEWITNPDAQEQLAETIAAGVSQWFLQSVED